MLGAFTRGGGGGRPPAAGPAPPGDYQILVTLEPTYSSKGYFKKELKAGVYKAE
jgi:hypothetical protein